MLDTARRLLGANQPEVVANILGDRFITALELSLPLANQYALARLIEACARAREAQAFSELVHHYPIEALRYIEAETSADAWTWYVKKPEEMAEIRKGEAVVEMIHALRSALEAHVEDYDAVIGDRLFEESIKEISFPVKTIKDALRKPFTQVKVIDPTGRRLSSKSDRLYFVCER